MSTEPRERRRSISIAPLMGLLALVGVCGLPFVALYRANMRPHREARKAAARASALVRPGMTIEEAMDLDTGWDWAGVGTDGGYGAMMFSYRGCDTRGRFAFIHLEGRDREWGEWVRFDVLEDAIDAIRAEPDHYGRIDELHLRWTVYETSYTLRLAVDEGRVSGIDAVVRERW